MTEFSIEDQIEDYLDTIFILSHSQRSVDSYRFAIGRFRKFVQDKYEKFLEQIISHVIPFESCHYYT